MYAPLLMHLHETEAVAALLASESLAAGVPVAVEPGGAGLDLVVGPREA